MVGSTSTRQLRRVGRRMRLMAAVALATLLFPLVTWMVEAMPSASAMVATAGLTITPITWNVIGLDRNDPLIGPNIWPAGARVCNPSTGSVDHVVTHLVWDSANPYIRISGPAELVLPALAANACREFYFTVAVIRDAAAYGTTRRFHIIAGADNAASVSTPTPRELYVERLGHNSNTLVDTILGPSVVEPGKTYQYSLIARTSPDGYEQLEHFIPFDPRIFEVVDVVARYETPAAATNSSVYADACGWDNDPQSPYYHNEGRCDNPAIRDRYAGGKAGGAMIVTYTVKIVGAGNTRLSEVISDFSQGSYHYTAGAGLDRSGKLVRAAEPSDLMLTKHHEGRFVSGAQGLYTLTFTNKGAGTESGPI